MNWSWELTNGMSSEDEGFTNNDKHGSAIRRESINDKIDALHIDNDKTVPLHIDLSETGLPKSESLSAGSKRSIFGWLRGTGYPSNEKAIREHSWLALDFSNEDSTGSTSSAGHAKETSERVEIWLNDLESTTDHQLTG